tara:strand:- start:304 stop:669 length:366 start_codon:yes stop_codon:yes gene_type:complete
MKVLLVDDDAFLRDMYALKFKGSGHEVETAESAASAFRSLETEDDFDAIVLDMIMPSMTGVEMIQEIKVKFPNSKAKFIVLSNQGQQEDINKATQAGAIGYIIKAESIPSDVVTKVEDLCK